MGAKTYFENLDALRFIAAFAVLNEHITRAFYFPDTALKKMFIIAISMDGSAAEAGVSFFFVLSGFLISYSLLEEHHTYGSISKKRFYGRRALRILPLYILSLGLGFIVHPIMEPSIHETADWRMYALFLANFDNIYFGWPASGVLGVQWSVSVEEQFYLVWPLLITVLVRYRQAFQFGMISLILVSIVYKLSGGHKYHTLVCLYPLCLGSLLAYYGRVHKPEVVRLLARCGIATTAGIYSLGLLGIFFKYKAAAFWGELAIVFAMCLPVFFAFVIFEQVYSPNSLFKLGRFRYLSQLGRMSYSIYLLHMVAIVIMVTISDIFNFSFWVSVAGTYLVALALTFAGYHFVERPFLNLRKFVPGPTA